MAAIATNYDGILAVPFWKLPNFSSTDIGMDQVLQVRLFGESRFSANGAP